MYMYSMIVWCNNNYDDDCLKVVFLSPTPPPPSPLIIQFEADVVGCSVFSDGRISAIDTWNTLFSRQNVLDDDQVSWKNAERHFSVDPAAAKVHVLHDPLCST